MEITNENEFEFDYLLELDNEYIVQEVQANKTQFPWATLCKFRDAIESTLSTNDIYETIEANQVDVHYFRNYINVRIPEQIRLKQDKIHGPIPKFYFLPSKSDDILHLADSDSPYLITPKDSYYAMYLALKLALIPPASFTPLLNYQRRYFKDWLTYADMLRFLIADYEEIIYNRLKLLELYIDTCAKSDSQVPSIDASTSDDEDNLSIKDIEHRQQVIAIMALLDHLYKGLENRPNNKTIAKFILFITGKNAGEPIHNTNTYKWISRKLVQTESRNIKNISKVRGIFEELMLGNIADNLSAEIKNVNF